MFTAHQFNVVRNMSDMQMAFLAEDLLSLYWDWRFDEFLLVLREGVRQNWGKTYDRLDPPTMHEWCKAYQAARTLQIENEAFQAHQALKKAEALPVKSELRQHPQFGADYPDARAQLDKLSDADLAATLQAYRKGQAADQQFIADVAQEVLNDRRAAFYLAQLAKQLPAETASDREAEVQAEAHRVQVAMLRGDRAAAGLPASTVPGLYDDLPDAPAFPGT